MRGTTAQGSSVKNYPVYQRQKTTDRGGLLAIRHSHIMQGEVMMKKDMESDDHTFEHQGQMYQIRIKGHLGPQWSEWFEAMVITRTSDGDTLLTGPVVDQSALHGVLKKIRDLGIPLLSVNPLPPDEREE